MPEQNPVANPVLGPTLDATGTKITVDTYVNPPTVIPAIIRDLVAGNEGYFIEQVFATPGMTVEGGAILYEETFPEDHFVPDDQRPAPRAPGSKAPRLGSSRRGQKVARPESWSGSIEVHDETRRRNKVLAVQRQFTQASNTFADILQTRGMETLLDAVTTWGRTVTGVNWRAARPSGTVDADPFTMPERDFAKVQQQFRDDKAGMMPDTVILHSADYFHLQVLYPEGKLERLLNAYGLTPLVTPIADIEGAPIYCKGGAVGVIAFEKPLDQEESRDGEAKTDIFTIESVPVFVAFDASAVLQVEGVNAS